MVCLFLDCELSSSHCWDGSEWTNRYVSLLLRVFFSLFPRLSTKSLKKTKIDKCSMVLHCSETSSKQFLGGFCPDGSCPPLTVEDHRFSDSLDRPLEITGTCQISLFRKVNISFYSDIIVLFTGFDLTEKFLLRKGTVTEDLPSFRLGSSPLIKPTK